MEAGIEVDMDNRAPLVGYTSSLPGLADATEAAVRHLQVEATRVNCPP